MIYTDLDSLCDGFHLCSIDHENSLVVLRHLFRVYFDALENPPQSVIGVGVISYAQEMLVKAQLDNEG
jgi:hypothetical protein